MPPGRLKDYASLPRGENLNAMIPLCSGLRLGKMIHILSYYLCSEPDPPAGTDLQPFDFTKLSCVLVTA
jgi:hypothetical protein